MNKEFYFERFDNLIKKIKNNDYDLEEINKYFSNISEYDDLSFQDVITYTLYCFKTIELTQKWKLKNKINFDLFYNNMNKIYDEVFCFSNLNLNNKIFALTSFGNILTNIINYNVENYTIKILDKYIEILKKDKKYLQNAELSLLRGNLYCQIYNTVLDNIDVNESYKFYIANLKKLFNSEKYIKMANGYFDEVIYDDEVSYDDLTNYLSFKASNKMEIDNNSLNKILYQLIKNYRENFFDKNIFIYLLNKIFENKFDLKISIEYAFEDKKSDDTIYINYNNIECSLENNKQYFLEILKKISSIKNKDSKFFELNKTIDELNLKKKDEVDSIINYDNLLLFDSISTIKDILDEINLFDEYFNLILNRFLKENKNINVTDTKKYISNNEIFEELYNNNEIKTLIEDNKILLLEYDDEGLYKNISAIIKEKINNKDNQIYSLISNLRNHNLYSLLNDYYSLLLIDSIDSNIIKEKERAFKKILPTLVENYLEFYGKLSKEKNEEIFNDYINPCIKKISQARVNNKSFTSTKDFLNYEKSNSDNYFGICKLQEIFEDE